VPAASQAADQMDQDLDGGPASTDPLGPDTAQMMAAHEPEFTAIAVFLEPTLLVKVRDAHDMPGLDLTVIDGLRPHSWPCM